MSIFCCVCRVEVTNQQEQSKYKHSCPNAHNPVSGIFHAVHQDCFNKIVNQNAMTAVESDIMRSLLYHHLGKKYTPGDTTSNESIIAHHMHLPHNYIFCTICKHIYAVIKKHAKTHSSQLEVLNCIVPFCEIAYHELNYINNIKRQKNNVYTGDYQYYLPEIFNAYLGDIQFRNGLNEKLQNKDYHISRNILGEGVFATVSKCYVSQNNDTIHYFARKHYKQHLNDDGTPSSNECVLLSSLKHPNILRCFGGIFTNNELYMFIELSICGSLEQVIGNFVSPGSKTTCLNPFVILYYTKQLALALDYLADKNIVHRDIKPANVMLFDSQLVCKLVDFGEATHLANEIEISNKPKISFTFNNLNSGLTWHTQLTFPQRVDCPGSIKSNLPSKIFRNTDNFTGTPVYVAPEIPFGFIHTAKSDIWSLGCIIYYMMYYKSPIQTISENYYRRSPKSSITDVISAIHDAHTEIFFNRKLKFIQVKPRELFAQSYLEILLSNIIANILKYDSEKRLTAIQIVEKIFKFPYYKERFVKIIHHPDKIPANNSNYIRPTCYNLCRREIAKRDRVITEVLDHNRYLLIKQGLTFIYDSNSNQIEFSINIFIEWKLWFRVTGFTALPKFRDFFNWFIRKLGVAHNSVFLLIYNIDTRSFVSNAHQNSDTYCLDNYYCLLDDLDSFYTSGHYH